MKIFFYKSLQTNQSVYITVKDRRYIFHFRPKPNIWPEKHLALGQIPKPKVQIYVKLGGILLQLNVSNVLSK